MNEEKKLFEEIVLSFDGTELGSMFGKPCGKINKKAFVAFFQDEMVFKVGKEAVALQLHKYQGSQNWDPSGKKRPMKDWIQVPAEYKEDWQELAEQALVYLKNG